MQKDLTLWTSSTCTHAPDTENDIQKTDSDMLAYIQTDTTTERRVSKPFPQTKMFPFESPDRTSPLAANARHSTYLGLSYFCHTTTSYGYHNKTKISMKQKTLHHCNIQQQIYSTEYQHYINQIIKLRLC